MIICGVTHWGILEQVTLERTEGFSRIYFYWLVTWWVGSNNDVSQSWIIIKLRDWPKI